MENHTTMPALLTRSASLIHEQPQERVERTARPLITVAFVLAVLALVAVVALR